MIPALIYSVLGYTVPIYIADLERQRRGGGVGELLNTEEKYDQRGGGGTRLHPRHTNKVLTARYTRWVYRYSADHLPNTSFIYLDTLIWAHQ